MFRIISFFLFLLDYVNSIFVSRPSFVKNQAGQQIVIETILVFGAGVMVLAMVTNVFTYANTSVTNLLTERYLTELSEYIASAILITYESGKDLYAPTPEPTVITELELTIPKKIMNHAYLIELSRSDDAVEIYTYIPGTRGKFAFLYGLDNINITCCSCDNSGQGIVWNKTSVLTSDNDLVIKYIKPYKTICDRHNQCEKVKNALCIDYA